MNKTLKMCNNFLLIKPSAEVAKLQNGMSFNETRGKRDIISGTIVCTGLNDVHIMLNQIVWFPLYAATPIEYEGEQFLVVAMLDIIMIKEGEKN